MSRGPENSSVRRPCVVVTSIAHPNEALRAIAQQAETAGYDFFVIGDEKSPPSFELDGCRFYGIAEQRRLEYEYAARCPASHYSRKNIGYLLAIGQRAPWMLETDDDNTPRPAFWTPAARCPTIPVIRGAGWLNVYRYFSDELTWPRGFPLDAIQGSVPPLGRCPVETVHCPIQQAMADGNPDVDAVYRLTRPLPQFYRADVTLAAGKGSWCPFNSQATAWLPEAYPLLYLPCSCSFRMTDIWRGLVAQRVAWENDWAVLFRGPTVSQDRNDHNLMKDFEDEIPGYLRNRRLAEALEALTLEPGVAHLLPNLRRCYERLVEIGGVREIELELLDLWSRDLARIHDPLATTAQ